MMMHDQGWTEGEEADMRRFEGLALLHEATAAEDLVQETYLKGFQYERQTLQRVFTEVGWKTVVSFMPG